MSKSLSVEAPYLNVLYQPTGCSQGQNQTRPWRICKSPLLSLPSNMHGNTATTELLFVPDRTQPWTVPVTAFVPQPNMGWVFRHPVLTIKVLSLTCPIIPRDEPCCAALISVVGWTGDISPCFSSAQVPLMLSTRLAHHCRDSWWSLEGHIFVTHTNTWIMPIFCRKNCRLIKNGKVIHLQSKVKLSPGYWSSR